MERQLLRMQDLSNVSSILKMRFRTMARETLAET
jgi:hypothetical protein